VICPKCGEVNSSNFLFCGMCGTILEPARRASATVAAPPVAQRPVESQPVAVAAAPPIPPQSPEPVLDNSPSRSNPVPSISGPSLLGLDHSNAGPSNDVDDFRDRAFSGLASYGHPDEPKSAGKEILLTVLLLAALGGAGWWTYKNYIGVAGSKKAPIAAPAQETASNSPENPEPKPTEKQDVKETPPPVSSTESATPAPAAKTPVENAPPSETKQTAEAAPEKAAKPAAPAPIPARHEVSRTRVPASKPAPATDSGDALFRRGETYLYGRNGAQDCGNALKYLKMASDQQHAKARSMMGTMYATGHCVQRDLPSSYRWFALALRVDPNNSVLEKDLSAVWNQMTPPERQMATKRD
jgi:hypothetical protein